jgi:hypothetical protein
VAADPALAAGPPRTAGPQGPASPELAAAARTAAGRAAPRARLGRWWLAATLALTALAAGTAIALAPPGSAPAPEGLAFLLFVGSSVHVASTGWFYTVPAVRRHMARKPARYVWSPIALIAGAGAIAAVTPRAVLYWLLLPYFGWQFFHFHKQNLGIAALAAAARLITPLQRVERRALQAAGLATIAGLVTRPGRLQLPLPQELHGWWLALPVVAFAACVLSGVVLLARRPAGDRPAGFSAAYLTALAFGLPVFGFSSPYAAVAGLTIAHGLQYLLLMGLLAAGGPDRAGRPVRLAVLCNIALIGGSVLSLASDGLTGDGGQVVYGIFLGAVMAHFVIDAGLWRMRDEFPRAFLSSRLPFLTAP